MVLGPWSQGVSIVDVQHPTAANQLLRRDAKLGPSASMAMSLAGARQLAGTASGTVRREAVRANLTAGLFHSEISDRRRSSRGRPGFLLTPEGEEECPRRSPPPRGEQQRGDLGDLGDALPNRIPTTGIVRTTCFPRIQGHLGRGDAENETRVSRT